jgi:hypothetical protein
MSNWQIKGDSVDGLYLITEVEYDDGTVYDLILAPQIRMQEVNTWEDLKIWGYFQDEEGYETDLGEDPMDFGIPDAIKRKFINRWNGIVENEQATLYN